MKKIKLNRIAPIFIICLVILILLLVVTINIVRNNNINKQAIAYIDYNLNQTTIFCNGKNVKLKNEVLQKLKDEQIDLVINNADYIAKVDYNSIDDVVDLKINIKKDKSEYIINSLNNFKELRVNVKGISKDYISEYIDDELISNKIIVNDEGYAELILKNDNSEYKLSYIIPNNIDVQDIKLKKGMTKTIDIGIDKDSYTYGAVKVETDSQDSLQISYMDIKANEVGEYKIVVSCNGISKEAKVIVEQGAEKIELSNLTVELIEGNEAVVNATVLPESSVNKDLEWSSSDETIATVSQEGKINAIKQGDCEIIVSTVEEPKVTQKLQVSVKNKLNSITNISSSTLGQVDGITYINGIMLVNKTHPVPQNYAPGLQSIAYNAFIELRQAAADAGFDIQLLSGYRSYETQKGLYERYVSTYGQAEADTFSARPGTSEHQTGLAMDVGWIDDAYADTPSGKWLAANCYKYGFIIRYPKSKEDITGYKYEPWHIRYLGKDIAKDVYDSGLCLEEYLGETN